MEISEFIRISQIECLEGVIAGGIRVDAMGIGDPHVCYGFDYGVAVVGEPSCVPCGDKVLPLSEGDVVVEMVFVFETGADASAVAETGTTN